MLGTNELKEKTKLLELALLQPLSVGFPHHSLALGTTSGGSSGGYLSQIPSALPLLGEGQGSDIQEQVQFHNITIEQCCLVPLKLGTNLRGPGKKTTSFIKIIQGFREAFTDFKD